jgi:3-phenylpropionate/trans-cinnamate dioxygenase ferredoxin reductase component
VAPAVMRWQNADGTGTAVALNYRMPVPKLRALSRKSPAAA